MEEEELHVGADGGPIPIPFSPPPPLRRMPAALMSSLSPLFFPSAMAAKASANSRPRGPSSSRRALI